MVRYSQPGNLPGRPDGPVDRARGLCRFRRVLGEVRGDGLVAEMPLFVVHNDRAYVGLIPHAISSPPRSLPLNSLRTSPVTVSNCVDLPVRRTGCSQPPTRLAM